MDHKLKNAPREERMLHLLHNITIEDEYHVFLFCKHHEAFRNIYMGDIKTKTDDSLIRLTDLNCSIYVISAQNTVDKK